HCLCPSECRAHPRRLLHPPGPSRNLARRVRGGGNLVAGNGSCGKGGRQPGAFAWLRRDVRDWIGARRPLGDDPGHDPRALSAWVPNRRETNMANVVGTVWEMLAGRTTGPLTLRLIIQPTMAALLGIRAGLKDAKEGRTPYLATIFKVQESRKDLIREGWTHVRKVAFMAFVIDAVYQMIVFHWIYVIQAVVVALVLAILPYIIVRGLTTRAVSGGERAK